MPNLKCEEKEDDLTIELNENPIILSRLEWLIQQKEHIESMIRSIQNERIANMIRALDAPRQY